MAAIAAERDLLFGLLALQNGLINQVQLVAAFQAWTLNKARDLAEHLVGRGDLDADDRSAVLALVARHLKKHGGDVERSLAAIPAGRSTRASLARIDDPDVSGTLAHLGSGSTHQEEDADRTAPYSVGEATSDGQRFRVLRPHARGGLGAVFVALDEELHREVALKQILEKHADDPTSRARFLLEAEVTGGLEHPGIVPVYGLGTHADGRPFYAMRFIRGDSLKEAIERFHADGSLKNDSGRRSLALQKLLRRFLDVCNAIEYAHTRGVLHRDIKPGNIIVGRHGETLVVDWGLAKAPGRADAGSLDERPLVPSSASGSAETLPGSALGTPAYMSPEQAAGLLEDLGPRSDVYSLGATLYCLLTGRAPFEGDDLGALLRAVQRGEFPPPRRLDPSTDRALEALCLKAMAVRPEDRYASPRALAEDLERWLADEPVSAHREPWWERARRQLKRHRSMVGALAIGGPVAIISLATLAAHEGIAARQFEENNTRLARANAESLKSLDKAQRREDLAFSALDNYRRVIHEIPELGMRPDLLPVRRRLLEAPLEFYRQLKQEADGSDPAERAAMSARVALADFGLAAVGAELGSEADAIKAYGEAIGVMESLVGKHKEPQYRQQLAMALNNLANLHVNTGRLALARRELERSLSLHEGRLREYAGSAGTRSDLALGHHNLGWLDSKTGRPESALAHYRKAVELREALSREAPGEDWRRTSLAQSLSNLGWFLASLHRRDEARECLVRARDIQEEQVAHQPTYVSLRIDLAMTYDNLSSLEEGDAALAPQRRSVELREAIVQEAPAMASYQAGLAISLMSLGNVHRNARRFDAALAAQERAVAVMEPLVRGHPESANFRVNLASCLNHVGLTRVDAGRSAEAILVYRRALDLLAPVLQQDTLNAEVRSLIAGCHNDRGLALAKLGRHEEALLDYRQAIEEERACFEAAPQLYQYRKWLNLHIYNMGNSLRALGRLDEAYATYRDRMKLWSEGPPEHRSPEENYDDACSLALLVPAVGRGKSDGELTAAERTRRRDLTDEAFAELRAAVDGGFGRTAIFVRDPDFDAIRSDPRFDPLLLRVMDRTFPAVPFGVHP
jgi:eukaryotic-like serine/threonine-protein kinase